MITINNSIERREVNWDVQPEDWQTENGKLRVIELTRREASTPVDKAGRTQWRKTKVLSETTIQIQASEAGELIGKLAGTLSWFAAER